MSKKRKKGTVKWFSEEKGYGFIEPDEGGEDLFVHHSDVERSGFANLNEGDQVQFQIEQSDRGPKAVTVEVIKPFPIDAKVPRDTKDALDEMSEMAVSNLYYYLHQFVDENNGDLNSYLEGGPNIGTNLLKKEKIKRAIDRKIQQRNRLKNEIFLEGSEPSRFQLQTNWRLLVGFGTASPLEIGLTLHPVYGIPYIPGSAIKGVTRSWIIQKYILPHLIQERGNIDSIKDQNIERMACDDAGFRRLFGYTAHETDTESPSGEKAGKGEIVFMDAFPVEPPTIVRDIMTPHYQDYYSSEEETPPTDDMNPVPVPFYAVEDTKFSFLLGVAPGSHVKNSLFPEESVIKNSGESSVLDVATTHLKEALREFGIGAKTSVGYGYFDEPGK